MRTKALLSLAALAACAVTASAQVYSANVVGYVNKTCPGGYAYTFLANPLNATDNHLSALFPAANMPDGASVYTWDYTTWDFSADIPAFSTDSMAWSSDPVLAVGDGFWFINPGENPVNVTFVGEVVQTAVTKTIHGGYAYNAIGSSVPLGGSFANAIAGIVPEDGDTLYTWDSATWDWGTTIPAYSTDSMAWSEDVAVAAGDGLMYIRPGTDFVWTRTFTVAP